MLLGPLANPSVLVQGFLRVHNIAVQPDRLGERATVGVAGIVIKRPVPLELVGNPVIGGGILIRGSFLDDIQESAMIHVVNDKMRSILL